MGWLNNLSAPMRGLVILGILIAVTLFACVGPAFFWLPAGGQGVALPVITLPGEVLVGNVLPGALGYDLTNTLTSLILVDVILIIIALVVGRRLRSQAPDRFVPRGFTNFMELLGEFLYNQTRGLVGNKARAVFPLAASIFILILIANWIKLVPGFETVGIIACAEPGQVGYPVAGISKDTPNPYFAMRLENPGNDLKLRTGTKATEEDTHACEEQYKWAMPPLVQAQKDRGTYKGETKTEAKTETTSTGETKPAEGTTTEAKPAEGTKTETAAAEESHGKTDLLVVVPFFRGATTDLNLPLAMAIIVFLMVQVWGVQALGPAYFFKFINLPALGKATKNPMTGIDFIVGLIEIVSELSRLVSLTFRLFGAVTAGGILLIVLNFMVAFLVPIPIYFLELFVGAIQAYVFAVLTMIYASQAVIHHGDDDEHHGEEHAHAH